MKDDDEIRRLKRFIVISWGLLLAVVLLLAVLGSLQASKLNRSIQVSNTAPKIIKGVDGKDGLPGEQGLPGIPGSPGTPGTDGQNITPDQIVAAVTQYMTLNPVTGQQGPAGTDGKNLQVQIDPASCLLESKYDTDAFWSVLAQLPIPCEVNP
jgi:hypothetical protein